MKPGLPPPDPWVTLRQHTPARIGLGRSGHSLPTAEVLRFAAAHAAARDAVHLPLDVAALAADLAAAGLAHHAVQSQAAHRAEYLRRPDLGRRLADADAVALRLRAAATQAEGQPPPDLAVVLADGLSAQAVQRHAVPLLCTLRQALGERWHWAPITVATQARVALGDEVGAAWQARLVLVLVGERPGLSSPDSLGAYLTHTPRPGRVDAERNCVSNIRPQGLPPAQAALRLAWLLAASLRRGLSGVALKDDSATALLAPPGGLPRV